MSDIAHSYGHIAPGKLRSDLFLSGNSTIFLSFWRLNIFWVLNDAE